MSASLAVVIPLALLAIISLLCFVGCALKDYGLGASPFTQYTDQTILPTAGLVAYWPLGEPSGSPTAANRVAGSPDGAYTDMNNTPPNTIFPCPSVLLAPNVNSAAAPGNLSLGESGIVQGDTVQPGNDPNVLTTCMLVNGGFVNVSSNLAKINPLKSFTIEAWVRVDWTSSDEQAYRSIIDSRSIAGGVKGFALYAKPDDNLAEAYRWEVFIGTGQAGQAGGLTVTSDGTPVGLRDTTQNAGQTHYVAATYDQTTQTLTLYWDYMDQNQVLPTATGVYVPNITAPLYIGQGTPWQPFRANPGDTTNGPFFPFNGAIEDVAIYNVALKASDIMIHYANGNGGS
jgi:Concanavalin A-like lectin/glucanases superfamily